MSRAGFVASFVVAGLFSFAANELVGCGDDPQDADTSGADAGNDALAALVDAETADASTAIGVDAAACPSRHADVDGGCHPLVFLSAKSVAGDLGGGADAGVGRADAMCQAEGAAHFPGATFKAWLSGGGSNAKDRLRHSTRPYRLRDGNLVAISWDKFASAFHILDLDIQADGTRAEPNTFVLTGTDPSGTEIPDQTCSNWTTGAVSARGKYGASNKVSDGEWTDAASAPCALSGRLYCIEEVP
jgi:hypothetical protein